MLFEDVEGVGQTLSGFTPEGVASAVAARIWPPERPVGNKAGRTLSDPPVHTIRFPLCSRLGHAVRPVGRCTPTYCGHSFQPVSP